MSHVNAVATLLLVFFVSNPVFARGGHGGGHHSSRAYSSHSSRSAHSFSKSSRRSSGHHSQSYCSSCSRDSHGRIKRSGSARHQFMLQTGYPHGRKGYVIDHIVPLKHGGADSPNNMQWQTKEEAKAKDKWE